MDCLAPRFYANLYAVLAAVIAITLLLTYPPLRSPHERQHFLHGLTFSSLYEKGRLPRSILVFTREAVKKPRPKRAVDDKPLISQWLPVPARAAERELHPQAQTRFSSHSNVAVYSFVNYVPQIIAGTLGDLYTLKPVTIFYLARAICLLSGVAVGYLILRLLPAYHLPVMVALLFPSGWAMRIQQYADQTVITAAFLYFTLLVRALWHQDRMGWRHMAGFIITGIIVSASKIVYFPLTLSLLVIPTRQFDSVRRRIIFVTTVLLLSLSASATGAIHALHADYGMNVGGLYEERNPKPWNKKRWEKKELLVHQVLKEPFKVLQQVGSQYVELSFLQAQLRGIFIWHVNRYAPLLKPYGSYPLLLAFLPFIFGFIAVRAPVPASMGIKKTDAGGYVPSAPDRVLLLCIILLTAMLVAVALYTGNTRFGVQGRYMVPLLPFLAMAGSIRLPERWYAHAIMLQLVVSLSVLGILYLGILGLA